MNQRLRQYVDVKYDGNYAAMANDLSYSKQRVYKYIRKDSMIPAEMVGRLIVKDPTLNVVWLLTGVGSMLHN